MKHLSIITVTYNDEKNLVKTIESIKKQKNKNFEFIIIDGGSSDNTKEIAKKNELIIDKFISERDNGIYNAMNKGIDLSNGEYLLFLNSGDVFSNELSVENIYIEVIKKQLDIGYFNVELCKDEIFIKKQPKQFSTNYLLYNNICHQSMIISRNIFNKYGYYNEDNKIFADYEFNYKVVKKEKDLKIKGNDKVITKFDLNGISSRLSLGKKILERYKVIKKYGDIKDIIMFLLINTTYKPIEILKQRGKI